jgi:protein-S-isoprenylcysteine O-methyltransferase Ste14
MTSKVWLVLTVEVALFALLLFGAAGTLRWPEAWVFLVLFIAATIGITLWLARSDPALLDERMKPLLQKGQPLWDKLLMSFFVVLFVMWLMLMGLDAVRYRWSHVPVWLEALGAAGFLVAMWISYLAFRENTFLSAAVRIQKERGQRVIDTGPYAVVRHPLYAGVLILLPSIALLLGSAWGVVGALVLDLFIAVRALNEERELERGLEGYREYRQRVRYRLLPGVW